MKKKRKKKKTFYESQYSKKYYFPKSIYVKKTNKLKCKLITVLILHISPAT